MRIFLSTALAAALLAASASASSIDADFNGVSPKKPVQIQNDGFETWTWAGYGNFSINSRNNDGNHSDFLTAMNNDFGGYCIDLKQGIYRGNTGTWTLSELDSAPTPGPAMGLDRAKQLAWLFDYLEGVKSAEFQLAVWEIVNEDSGTFDLANGTFRASHLSQYDSSQPVGWFAALNSLDPATLPMPENILALTSDTMQDFAVSVDFPPPPPPEVIPEPITLLCMLAAGGSLAGYIRKRRSAGA
ncbi:MAG TPA: hypothetical protein ENL03_05290 [Phycisphaerae bacterium]|nr:hypothetical protein [Phycisphaerae bacterium]